MAVLPEEEAYTAMPIVSVPTYPLLVSPAIDSISEVVPSEKALCSQLHRNRVEFRSYVPDMPRKQGGARPPVQNPITVGSSDR